MFLKELNPKYFPRETRGYKIINRFCYKYKDLFERTAFPNFNDFINQIFLNVSSIDFSRDIKNFDAYIIGTIKIQCRAQLDKAIKMKNLIAESRLPINEEEEPVTFRIPAKTGNLGDLFDIHGSLIHRLLFNLLYQKNPLQS